MGDSCLSRPPYGTPITAADAPRSLSSLGKYRPYPCSGLPIDRRDILMAYDAGSVSALPGHAVGHRDASRDLHVLGADRRRGDGTVQRGGGFHFRVVDWIDLRG
jgi:hypothetical protein